MQIMLLVLYHLLHLSTLNFSVYFSNSIITKLPMDFLNASKEVYSSKIPSKPIVPHLKKP